MMIDRRMVPKFDWTPLLTILALVAVGLVAVYSATYSLDGGRHGLFLRQIIWLAGGLVMMFVMMLFDYRSLARWGYILYGAAVLMLLAVLVAGRSGLGAQRWLALGPFSFQPSEIAKLFMVVALARFFSDDGITDGHTLTELVKPFLMVVFPVFLVMKQPDLGTALMFIFIFCAMVAVSGIRVKSLLGLACTVAIAAPLAWKVAWGHMKDYQKKRILVFISPDSDPAGAGYHIIQSKIAIGSGSLTGKGFLNGTQSQLSFLPERHTDFIFSVVAEEWGFIGSLLLLLIYLFIILWGLETAYKARDRFGALLAVGTVSMLTFYVVINVGMTLGIMPVVGVPLPLVSYGGTSAMTTLLALGLLLNIYRRRFSLFY